MEGGGIEYYIVPSGDEFNSEFVGKQSERLGWISGFTGSGVAIISKTDALLFTDSRYWIKAKNEISPYWTLMKVGNPDVKSWTSYCLSLPTGSKIGIDPRLVTYSSFKKLSHLNFIFPSSNLIDQLWLDQPNARAEPIKLHPIEFAGVFASTKIFNLRETVATYSKEDDVTYSFLITTLPAIAWILNIRGDDILTLPVVYSYLLIKPDSIAFFVDSNKINNEVGQYLEKLGVEVIAIDKALEVIAQAGNVLAGASISQFFVGNIKLDKLRVLSPSPVDLAQSIKNPIELQQMKSGYLRDGVSWVKWSGWLEEQIITKKLQITEWEAAEKLTEYRSTNPYFSGLAYENISATGENAALPHYAPTATKSSIINTTTPYLNDSGAQYSDGTTIDTTRTVHFGRPTPEQRLAFTCILQGHIAIGSAVFPMNTTGFQLDLLARLPLCKHGLTFGHGTGHLIGSYLSVHESESGVGIGSSKSFNITPLQPGNVISNEPGFYREGEFGIRTESIVTVVDKEIAGLKFLGFERLTVVPIQSSLCDLKLMSKEERNWLKDHNDDCRRKLLPFLKDDKRARAWLKRQ